MRDEKQANRWSSSAGNFSLVLGAGALCLAFLPVIGDFVAFPAAGAALVLGFMGIRRHESGQTPQIAGALIGTILAAVALLVLFMFAVASR